MNKTVLFCIPLKEGCLEQYKAFAKEVLERPDEYRDMFNRYDILSAKVWIKRFGDCDYVLVCHDVGPDFEEKMKGWDTSEYPYDQWFNKNIMAVYDVDNVEGMEKPEHLFDFYV